jgi:hypothetical protein
MAITGPYTSIDVDTAVAWRRRTWHRQTRPRIARLRYGLRDQKILVKTGSAFGFVRGSDTTYQSGVVLDADTPAYNLAYAKLVESVGEHASWAVTLAERRQAVDMIRKRASQILAFTRALRKGRLGDAWDALDVPRTDPRRLKVTRKHLRKKDLAGRYLEFHFGWSPLMSDIHTSCSILGRDFPTFLVKGRGRATAEKQYLSEEPRRKGTVVTRCQILADISIQNPNLLLWSQLGLVNPATVLWELVPFSFVVDWFVNVGEYLSHFTDFVGVGLSNIAETYSRSCDESAWYSGTGGWPNARVDRKWFWLDRYPQPSLRGPTLSLRPFKGFSVRRGLAAVSLLIQNLPKR